MIGHYEEANERNEFDFCQNTEALLDLVKICDQFWKEREPDQVLKIEKKKGPAALHSKKAVDLIQAFVDILEEIPDGCAEMFPFEMIDRLKREYFPKQAGRF